jgi:hypothetical protein
MGPGLRRDDGFKSAEIMAERYKSGELSKIVKSA